MPSIVQHSAYRLYRRGPLWIKEEFDNGEGDEINLNHALITRYTSDLRKNPTSGTLVFSTQKHAVPGQEDTNYWSLYADKPSATNILINYAKADIIDGKAPNFYEFKYDAGVFGPGWLRTYVTPYKNTSRDGSDLDPYNGNIYDAVIDDPLTMVQKYWGPCSWQISDYHLLEPGDWIQFFYTNNGKSDPIPRCEIDNLTVYPYRELDCEMAVLSPGKADNQPKKIQVLRGFNAFQTTTNISTVFEATLRFYSAQSHSDFLVNCGQPHALCDEKGMLYRGTIETTEVEHLGGGIYEQKIKFYSNSKLGLGWK